MAVALLAAPEVGNATSYTFNLTGNVGDGTTNNFSLGGLDYQTYELLLSLSGPPVALQSGDDITMNLTLDGPLIVPGGDQFFGFNLITSDPPNASTVGTITFSGLSGGPIANPQPGACTGCLSNIIFTSGLAYQFLGLSSVATYLFDGDEVTFSEVSISYQVTNPSEVPLPAALPLFATGAALLAFVARRRKRKGAAATVAA